MIKVATLGLLSFKKVIHTCRISAATRTFGELVRYNFEDRQSMSTLTAKGNRISPVTRVEENTEMKVLFH